MIKENKILKHYEVKLKSVSSSKTRKKIRKQIKREYNRLIDKELKDEQILCKSK